MRGIQNDREERKAMFLERLELDMDRTTKELLDSTRTLDWMDAPSVGSIDRWIATTEAALAALRAARSGVGA